MKQQLVLPIFLFAAFQSSAQTYYQGLERMCWVNENGKKECYDPPRKWYHLNTLLVDKDSIFLYKVPVVIEKKDTSYSASDGAFYYYYGAIKQTDSAAVAYLTRYNCDYCGKMVKKDSVTGFFYTVPKLDTLPITKSDKGFTIGKTIYKPIKPNKDFYFPDKNLFYFDSNSIYRREPKGQYGLIAQGIKNFLQTKQLRLDKDTLRICIERHDPLNETILIETLTAGAFHIDTIGIQFVFLTRNQLRKKSKKENKVIRYIEINEIIDYWKAARIELTYRIIVPKSMRKFSEYEYSNLFRYDKIGQQYVLKGNLPENNLGLVEQK
jgi:hypothetical protein